MDDDDRDIHWSEPLEVLIASEGERCRGLAWLHQKAELKFSALNNRISIPVIILSTLSGATSMSSSSLFGEDTKSASIGIGLVCILTGVLNTISSYFAFSRKAEAHRIASLNYSKLFSNILVELSLPRPERLPPDQILKTLRDNMERLAETTPTPPQDILDAFNKHFKDEDKTIARPIETNGLQKISIYRDFTAPKNIVVEVEDATQRTQAILTPRSDARRREGRSGVERSEDESRTPRRGSRQETAGGTRQDGRDGSDGRQEERQSTVEAGIPQRNDGEEG